MKRLLECALLLGLLICASPADAQTVQQSGNVTQGHIASWATNGVIKDGGAVTANDSLSGGSTTSITSGQTFYCSPAGCATSAAIAALVPFTGTAVNLNAAVATAPGAGQTVVATLMTGPYGSLTASAATCTISAAATSCSDATHQVNVPAGQAWAVRLVTSGSAASTGGETFGLQFISGTPPQPSTPYVLQSGNITSGHAVGWITNGVIGDAGVPVNNTIAPGPFVSGDIVYVNSLLQLASSGVPLSTVVIGPASAVSGNLPSFSGSSGKLLADSGVLASSVVAGPGVAVSGNLVSFNGTGGRLIQDSGIASTTTGSGSVVLQTSPALLGVPTAPTATPGTNTTQIATTAFVHAAIPSLCNDAGAFLVGIGASSAQCSDVAFSGGVSAILNAQAGTAAAVQFQDGGTAKWNIGKQTDNTFIVRDLVNSLSVVGISPGGPVAITTLANSWNQGLTVLQSGNTTSQAGPWSYNIINVTDQGPVTGPGVDGFGLNNTSTTGFRVNYNIANTGTATNPKSAALFATRVTSTQQLGDVLGAATTIYSNVAMNLTGLYVGHDIYATVDTGGSVNSSFEGVEIDVGLTNLSAGVAGSAANRVGLAIWNVGVAQASGLDTAIAVTNWNAAQSSAAGAFKNFVVFAKNLAGLAPFTTTATLFSFDTTATIANVFDFNSNAVTITGNILTTPTVSLAGSGLFTTNAASIGAVSTDRITLQNLTAAAAGAQQWSPRLHFIGQGWKTAATAASQQIDFIQEIQPIQDSASADAQFVVSAQVNGAGYQPVVKYQYNGASGNGNTQITIVSPSGKNANHTWADGVNNVWYLGNLGGSGDALALLNSDSNVNVQVARFFQSGGVVIGTSATDPGAGVLNLGTGLRIANAAASGHYLRGNGSNYVDSAIQAGDLPGGSNSITIAIGTNVGLSLSGCAPVALGGTCTISATTDTVQWTALGLGGAAPATGLRVYNTAVLPTGNGQAVVGSTATNGGVFAGQGSTNDLVLNNKSGSVVCSIATGGTTINCATLTLTNALAVAQGGTGITSFGTGVATALGANINTNGGLLTGTTNSVAAGAVVVGAGSGTAPTGVADVATGALLASGGVGTNPSYCTACTLSTSLTVPLDIGGTAAGSTKEVRSTSGTGSGDFVSVTGGTNGGTTLAKFFGSADTLTLGNGNTPSNTTVLISQNVTAVSGSLGQGPSLLQLTAADGSSTQLSLNSYGTGPNSVIVGLHARGTAAGPTAVAATDNALVFGGYAYDGTNWDLAGALNFQVTAVSANTNVSAGLKFTAVSAGSSKFMWLTSSGGLSIHSQSNYSGVTDPGAESLFINGQQFMPNITASSAAQTGTVCWTTGTGKFTVDTTVGCLTSIGEAKNVLGELASRDALDMIAALRPVSFRYKRGYGDQGRYEQFGLVAEEVAAVDERMAGRDFEGTLRGVRYMELTAVLTAAIKELKADNDNLRAELRRIAR